MIDIDDHFGTGDDGMDLLGDGDLAFDAEDNDLLNTKGHGAAEDNGDGYGGVEVEDIDEDLYNNMGDDEYSA